MVSHGFKIGFKTNGFKTWSLKTNEIFFIKVKTWPRPPKTAHSNMPPNVYITLCGKIAKHHPKVYAKKEGVIFILAVVLFLLTEPCPGDAVFRCESETTLFGLPKEDTTKNQWLNCIYNTVPEQFNPNIRVCAAQFTEDYFLNLRVACQLYTKAVSQSGAIPTL